MQTVTGLGSQIAGIARLVQQGQDAPQLRHQIARQLPPAILLGQGAQSLVPDPHCAIVACNVPRCNRQSSPGSSVGGRRARDSTGSVALTGSPEVARSTAPKQVPKAVPALDSLKKNTLASYSYLRRVTDAVGAFHRAGGACHVIVAALSVGLVR